MSVTSSTATSASNRITAPSPSSRPGKATLTAQKGSLCSPQSFTKLHPHPGTSHSSHTHVGKPAAATDSSHAMHQQPIDVGASYSSRPLTRRLQMSHTASIPRLFQNTSTSDLTDTHRDTLTSDIRRSLLTSHTRKGSLRDRLSLKGYHGLHRLSPRFHYHLDPSQSVSSTEHANGVKKPVQMKLDADARRQTYSEITFSLSQMTHIMRLERTFKQLPDDWKEKHQKRSCASFAKKKKSSEINDVILVPMDQELTDFKKDYFCRLEEAGLKRKSLRNRKRWLRAYRKTQSVLRISKNMAERSVSFEKESVTYVDIGDSLTVYVDYGAGRSIDMEIFKRKKEISISSKVLDTLTSVPEERTLVQLEEARRELQKMPVFSEYPLNVQEHVIRRAFYLTIGPKRVILREGHHPLNFFIIICGKAYVKKHVWDEVRGKTVATTEAFIKTGDTFGSVALIRGIDRTSSVISRTNMQLLAINGEDYLDLIFRRSLPDQLPPHIQYLSAMNFMENFPIHLLKEKLSVCSLHHFRRNAVIAHDSKKCRNLFIIKYGYCKVFRKLRNKQEIDLDQEITELNKRKSTAMASTLGADERYIERDSPYVSYVEVLSPLGRQVRVPVTKVPGKMDKMYHQPLTLPQEQRQFVPLMLLREGEVFGLDQTDMCPSRGQSRSTILVSLGAEVIALNKDFYCRHTGNEAREWVEKIFIYDDIFIHRRLRERVNRDVHLEEVLKFYFLKMAPSAQLNLPPVNL